MCTLFHFCLITTNTPIHFCLITTHPPPPTPLDFLFSFVTLSLSSTCIPPTLLFLPHYTTTTPDFLSLNPFLYSHLPYIFPHYMYPPPLDFLFSLEEGHILYGIAQYISDLLVLFLGGIAGFSSQEGKRSILYLSGIQQARNNLLVHVEMYCRLFLLMLQNSRPCLQLYRSHYSSGLWYSRENSGFSFPCSRGNSQFLSRLNIFII